jgi:hypothetical protein
LQTEPVTSPCGAEGALLIIDAKDEAAVRTRLADDPWSKSGHLRTGSIDSWTIWLAGQDERQP